MMIIQQQKLELFQHYHEEKRKMMIIKHSREYGILYTRAINRAAEEQIRRLITNFQNDNDYTSNITINNNEIISLHGEDNIYYTKDKEKANIFATLAIKLQQKYMEVVQVRIMMYEEVRSQTSKSWDEYKMIQQQLNEKKRTEKKFDSTKESDNQQQIYQ